MSNRTCIMDECANRPHARGLCPMHYARLLRNGTPNEPHRRQRSRCTVDDCERFAHARGLCTMHYSRFRKTGDPTKLLQAPDGSGTMTADGYRLIYAPGHPVSRGRKQVLEHRVLLYDFIGPGEHPCHWCGCMVAWTNLVPDPHALVVDHVDADPSNNELSNLVPSCIGCNSRRANGCHLVPASTAAGSLPVHAA